MESSLISAIECTYCRAGDLPEYLGDGWYHCNGACVQAKCSSTVMVEWIEPDEHGDVVTKRITAESAIAQVQAMVMAKEGVTLTRKQALDDFIVVNWATVVLDIEVEFNE